MYTVYGIYLLIYENMKKDIEYKRYFDMWNWGVLDVEKSVIKYPDWEEFKVKMVESEWAEKYIKILEKWKNKVNKK